MSQEKVLWFLGLEREQKINKYVMKYAFWSDFFITVFIVACGLLFEVIPITFSNVIWLVALVFMDIIFFVYLKMIHNPVCPIPYSFIVFIITTIKLVYAFLMFSKAELIKEGYPIITWAHIIILVLVVLATMFILAKNYVIWQDLKKKSIEDVTEKILENNKKIKWKWIVIILGSFSPMVFVRLFDKGMSKLGLGMGFGFWLLSCCWLLMACLLIPKFIVSVKYGVFKCFQEHETGETGDGSLS